ncbi:hypothetical protein [Aeromonas piscicola]|uniref:hypothetical protein n=1 Tax=Aeromonas piscicola TaxID=600645 RepID=UPI0021F86F1A|nr:hypothetical protein [Aeromonas piscicola]MCW0507219.1 hypothetical protein [Aeromonas piscicola]
MTNEHTLLALLDSKEAEANAKDEWITEWVETNRLPLLSGQLDTDAATLLAEVNADQAIQLNQTIYLLMLSGDKVPLTLHIQQLLEQGLTVMADDAWSDHVAALQDVMNSEQWEQYQQRNAA